MTCPRLARNGLIERVPERNRYILTRDGLLFACFYTRVYDHILRPLMAPDRPNAPPSSPQRSMSWTESPSPTSPWPAFPPPPDLSRPCSTATPAKLRTNVKVGALKVP